MTQQMQLQRGLVGHWTMDDANTSNDTVYDSSAHSNDCDVSNCITGSSSTLGQAIESDASGNQQAIVDDNDTLDGQDEITISFWLYSQQEDTGDFCWIIRKSSLSGSPYHFADEGTSSSNCRVRNTNGDIYNSGIDIETDTWNHHAVSYARDGSAKWFKNGEKLDEKYTSDYALHTNDYNVTLMGDGGANAKIRLSDVRIYNRQLSESEINQLYQMREQRHYNI